jgi:hypothetical protein
MANESWSKQVAVLAVDALVDRGFLLRDNFDAAVEIAAEEIQIRLAMGDYPPIENQSGSGPP